LRLLQNLRLFEVKQYGRKCVSLSRSTIIYFYFIPVWIIMFLLCAIAKLQEATISSVMSVRLRLSVRLSVRLSTWNNLTLIGRIFMKFDIWVFFVKLLRKFKVQFNLTRITCTLYEDWCTFSITSLLRMRSVSDKICTENQNSFCVQYLIFENLTFYEIMWKNILELGRSRMTIWRMRIAC